MAEWVKESALVIASENVLFCVVVVIIRKPHISWLNTEKTGVKFGGFFFALKSLKFFPTG